MKAKINLFAAVLCTLCAIGAIKEDNVTWTAIHTFLATANWFIWFLENSDRLKKEFTSN